ncbi:hypothetical protein AUEXF2481DRAFT_40283 [Aureobasidium subglaciale EXF-2481]|uniref:Uncharacterized protein n=1 Tax=Aureobasidium subglaciale (strain EXF-2481) TaxID=1043005 RepID=A0A074YB46_AURSE|nr:uncharacterized protein AUEXF2481DRAFT_40283 [Aureobasidium subglaciale EXF-2481]KEQ95018.1 hypothetical protein AUEXF2481DRAFT_40283 [Aureobasidium subglaciale EXF-2481]
MSPARVMSMGKVLRVKRLVRPAVPSKPLSMGDVPIEDSLSGGIVIAAPRTVTNTGLSSEVGKHELSNMLLKSGGGAKVALGRATYDSLRTTATSVDVPPHAVTARKVTNESYIAKLGFHLSVVVEGLHQCLQVPAVLSVLIGELGTAGGVRGAVAITIAEQGAEVKVTICSDGKEVLCRLSNLVA